MPSLFSESLPTLQLFWDAHSLSTFLTCPRKYQYQILQSYIPSGQAIDLDWGIGYHDALAAADIARFNGADHTEQMVVAVEHAMDRPEFEGATTNKNRFSLARSVVWNLEHFQRAPVKSLVFDGKPAVELSFSFPTEFKSSTGEHFGLCGYMDGALESPMGVVVLERKTTKNTLSQDFFDGFSPNIQVSVYTLAGQVIFPEPARGVQVQACQTAVNFSEYAQRIFLKTPAQIDELWSEINHWLIMADHYAQENWWPKNEASCRICPFKGTCSKDPNVRDQFLKDPMRYKKREWNPLEPR